jgi:hypothetical protein
MLLEDQIMEDMAQYAKSVGEKRYEYRILMGKSARRRRLGRLREKEYSVYWSLVTELVSQIFVFTRHIGVS